MYGCTTVALSSSGLGDSDGVGFYGMLTVVDGRPLRHMCGRTHQNLGPRQARAAYRSRHGLSRSLALGGPEVAVKLISAVTQPERIAYPASVRVTNES